MMSYENNKVTKMAPSDLWYLIHHVFLPPKLPQGQDKGSAIARGDYILLSLLEKTASTHVCGASAAEWRKIQNLIKTMREVNTPPTNQLGVIQRMLERLSNGDVVAMHIRAQNAGVIIRHKGDVVEWELFEVSPSNESVIQCEGRLICSYPGPTVSIPKGRAAHPKFVDQIAAFLSSMSSTRNDDAIPHVRKARSLVPEERDTVEPRYITELLTGILRGCDGTQTKPHKNISKHVRDDVCWDSEYLPWRRSPLWLVVRVALQSTFTDNNHYKLFMMEFISDICSLALAAGLDDDILSIMIRKLGRRAFKVGDKAMSPTTLEKVQRTLMKVPDALDNRWSQVQRSRTRQIPWEASKATGADTEIILGTTAKSYIKSRLQAYRNATENTTVSFNPSQQKRYRSLSEFILATSPFTGASELDKLIALIDFEDCVRESVKNGNIAKEVEPLSFDHVNVVRRISELMEAYSCHAPLLYKDNPELNSIYILTLMELWCEMDKSACQATPLLKDYSPEIWVELFEPLLFSKMRDMERLHKVEEYLKARENASRPDAPKIFDENNRRDSFAVRFYEQSPRLKTLRKQIEDDAARAKRERLQELARLNQKHQNLVQEASRLACSEYYNSYGRYIHSSCWKCDLQSQANNINIKTHEWPLPEDENKCKRVVFELSPDEAVAIWRKTTYHLLLDVFKTKRDETGDSSKGSFDKIPELKHRVQTQRRITLASTTKSWYTSHYQVRVNGYTSEREVCSKSAMNYQLYDTVHCEWATDRFHKTDLRPLCKIQLQGGPYRGFEYAVNGTQHTSNYVIAKQNSCPRDLTLEEYHAFCSLRSGSRLQWGNVLMELGSAALSFKREEVHDLIRAASCQVGSACTAMPLRDDHSDLGNPDVCQELLEVMHKFLKGIQDNWQECVAVKTLILVANRILSSSHDVTVIHEALSFLRFSRQVTLEWTRAVVAKLQEVDAGSDARRERNFIVHMAAICRMTFDVESGYQEGILEEDLATYLECGLHINDNCANIYSNLPVQVQTVLMRDVRCSVALEPIMHNVLSTSDESLNTCVASLWTQFTSKAPWQRLTTPNERWYTTKTQTTESGVSQVVHFNILENQLLVDGQPFGKLPSEIVSNPTYRRILKKRVLDIVPSDMKSMTFKTKRHLFGLNLHFAGDAQNLYIRTVTQDQAIHELIPYEVLQDDFATPLWKDSSHWLNLSSGDVEFRSLKTWSQVEPKDFVLSSTEYGLVLQNCSETVIHLRSKTMDMITNTLQGIEERAEILVTREKQQAFVKQQDKIQVKLPRYKLVFFCYEGLADMECQTIPDHVIDINQDIGTFYGLQNMLALRQKDDIDKISPRLVIVPHGTASASKTEGCLSQHPTVTITTTGDVRGYYVFRVDTRLGRLVDDGRLSSRFTRIHLHALTSHCLPDPLTMKRGTVEALQELRNAGSFSFRALHSDEFEILKRIASLTPSREYYPEHLKSMQTVKFDTNLPTLSQHDDFYLAVESIVQHWVKLEPFCGKQAWTSGLDKIIPALRSRAARRNSNFNEPSACSAVTYSSSKDVVYGHRHFPSNMESDVYEITSLVCQWPQSLQMETGLASLFQGMVALSKNPSPSYQRLSYSEEWLRLPVRDLWMNLYDLCRHATRQSDTYGLIFVLSSLYYSPLNTSSSNALVKTLLAFATNGSFSGRHLAMPSHTVYQLRQGKTTISNDIRQAIDRQKIGFHSSSESSLPRRSNESDSAMWARRNNTYTSNCNSQASALVRYFENQWPTRAPSTPISSNYDLFRVGSIMSGVTDLFKVWHINKDFFDYLSGVEVELRSMRGPDPHVAQFPDIRMSPVVVKSLNKSRSRIGLFDLFNRQATTASEVPDLDHIKIEDYEDAKGEVTAKDQLESLLDKVERKSGMFGAGMFGEHYVLNMRASLDAWRRKSNDLTPAKIHTVLDDMIDNVSGSTKCAAKMFREIHEALSPKDKCGALLHCSGLWPEISPRALLETLQFQNRKNLPQKWKDTILEFGEMLTLVQKAERMLRSVRSGNLGDFQREAENPGQVGWRSTDYPDWLLIELESDILIRPVQATIAEEMMEPSEGVNSVTQLNMGEGKSSVILPCTGSSLADGSRLVRSIVLKPLAGQMFKLLTHKLSGLVNRKIFCLPFSRDLDPSVEQIQQLQSIYEECKEGGGILLSLPEHILSMKLMGIDKSICGSGTAESLLNIQKWVDENARDILDESDEILHVRYQLIYTVGDQQLPEGGSDRWTILKEALNLFRIRAIEHQRENPRSIEISEEDDSSKFPSIRILTDQAGKDILEKVKDDIFNGRLPFVQMRHFSKRGHEEAKTFVTNLDVERVIADRVKETCKSSSIYQHLLLLRGLIAHGILLFVFKEKRYRVDYGLDNSRDNYNLAVPYRAKDVPATRAELAHIDVLLMLTYLSHYSKGLSNEDIYLCFEQLLKSDNPDGTYEDWISVCDNAPPALQKLRGVNLEDKSQFIHDVCPLLHRNRAVIDFYLATLIFPKQVKAFPEKICANGWDLAEERPNNRNDKKRFVTGFSGTNDNRYLLPTTIQQQDQEGLLHTNAMVLEHILKPQNNTVIHAERGGQRLEAEQVLDLVVRQSPPINVILDVGAQVLELTNDKVIRKWLEKNADVNIKGGIFFNDDDELTILNRDGSFEGFTGSATMAQQMSKYFVYLDEAHTRGTDLKLPLGSRAVVTLGPKLVKDKFVQGCMRMRKLADGHSLIFFAPPEVYNSIIGVTDKKYGDDLKTEDILLWTMLESCKQIHHSFPNWASQGFQYDKRFRGWSEYRENGNIENLKAAMLEPEKRSLEDMYGPKYGSAASLVPPDDAQGEMIQQIFRTCDKYGTKSLRNVEAEEEQEREVEQEREREREIERPPDVAAAKHSLHPVIRNFVRTGSVEITPKAVDSAFSLFERTSTRHDCHLSAWSKQLLASRDFIETVQLESHENMDHYIRPVRWILSSGSSDRKFLLISPYEANELIRDIQKSSRVRLHMYTPRVSRCPLIDFENLDVCPTPKSALLPVPLVPPSISMQLNLFSGQLFFKDYNTYKAVCNFLGLYLDCIVSDPDYTRENPDLFMGREERKSLGIEGAEHLAFDFSPIKFIEAVMGMRRKGMGYFSSHMGGIVHTRVLREDDF